MAKRAVAEGDGPSPNVGTDSKSVLTRQRLLDATAHVLSVRGYAGTRLSEIAREADVQAPAIYYYFSSRDELIEEVMWAGIHLTIKHVSGALASLSSTASPMERIGTAVEAHLRLLLSLSDYATASTRNGGQIPEAMRERRQAGEVEYGTLWQKLLADAAAAGELRSELDPRSARMLVLGAINWAAEWWNPRRESLDSVVETARSFVVHGLSYADGACSPEL